MLREVLARFGIEFDGSALQRGIGGLGRLAAAAAAAAAAVGVGLFLALRSLALEMAQVGDESAKVARQLGISADHLNAWRFAAERSGVDAGQLTNGLRRLQRNLVDAGEGVDTAVRAFADLGVSARDSNNEFREIEDVLPEIADGFAALESDTQRSARAQQLFGRAGAQLLPFFEEGSGGIDALVARFEELGGVMGEEFFANAEAAQDALSDYDLATRSLKASIATDLLPVLTNTVKTFATFVGHVKRLLDGTHVFRNGLRVLALTLAGVATVVGTILAPALIALAALFVPIVAAVGAIALIALAIDDVLTLLDGGDSVIGRFLDAMFGVGTAGHVADLVKGAWKSFVAFFGSSVVPVVMEFGAWLVGLWPRIQPGLRALGNAITWVGGLLAGLPALAASVGDAIAGAFAPVLAGMERAQSLAAAVGIGSVGAVGVGSGASVRAPTGGGSASVEQSNAITINGSGLSASELQAAVASALDDATNTALRVAERALTTVIG